jgi:iron complex outermembrane receptor protein
MRRSANLVLAVSVLAAANICAAESTTNRLPEVVVTSTRLPGEETAVEKMPANVTVITGNQIANSPSFTLPELLRQEVGLAPIDQVGLGASGNIALRGYGEKSGLLVLVDGVRMNDAGESGKSFLWNSIPLENIERIEIIRGGASTTYGEGAIAGVVNIITKKPADKPIALTLTGAGGSFGYYNVHAEARGKLEAFDYVVSGDRQAWDGFRDASRYAGWSAMARTGFNAPWGRLTLGYYFHNDATGIPDALTPAQYAADPEQAGDFLSRYTNTVHRGTLDYEKAFDSGWTVLGKLYGQVNDSRIASEWRGFPAGRQKIEQPNYGTTWQLSSHEDFAHRANLLTVGVEAIQQDFRVTGDYGDLRADNWTLSVFAQDTWQLTPQLGLTAGIRYDHREWDLYVNNGFPPVVDARRYASVWSPKVGLTYEFADQMNVWLTLARAYRLPTGNEIGAIGFFDGQPFYPNTEIDPIIANTIEIGTRINRWALLSGSLTYYYSHVQDDVVYNPFLGHLRNENFDINRQGVELALTSRPADWVDFYYTTAFTDARFSGGLYAGNRVPLTPEWQLTGGVNWRPLPGLQLTFETAYVAGQLPSNDLNNLFDQNNYVVCNARARYQWRWLTLFASANNLLDERYETYPLSNGLITRKYNPSPGFNCQVGATVTF